MELKPIPMTEEQYKFYEQFTSMLSSLGLTIDDLLYIKELKDNTTNIQAKNESPVKGMSYEDLYTEMMTGRSSKGGD